MEITRKKAADTGKKEFDPPGYSHALFSSSLTADVGAGGAPRVPPNLALLSKRAFEITQAQVPAVLQTAFMLYMFVGNQLNLFSIFFLINTGSAPIRNLMNTAQGQQRLRIVWILVIVRRREDVCVARTHRCFPLFLPQPFQRSRYLVLTSFSHN